jgi:hypothetical protein
MNTILNKEAKIKLSLRRADPYAHPLIGNHAEHNSILLKVATFPCEHPPFAVNAMCTGDSQAQPAFGARG